MIVQGIEFLEIPAGTFQMGACTQDRYATQHELPQHEVEVKPFWMSKFPITEGQYGKRESSLPVVEVSWNEALAFCQQRGFRLPTEEEWEYLCRAGSEAPFPGGNMVTLEEGNFLYDDLGHRIGKGLRTAVGCYPANRFGAHDMTGNVAEWTVSAWRDAYDSRETSEKKVIRGAGWDSLPRLLRCSNRDSAAPDQRKDNLGFRVAMDKSL